MCDLLPPAVRHARERAARLSLRRLVGCILLVWAGVIAIVAVRLRSELRSVEAELARLREPSRAVTAARREMAEAAAMLQAIRDDDQHRSVPLQQLLMVTLALPDSAYVTSFSADNQGQGTLTGAAKEAARVVSALSGGKAVAAPRMEGPAVRELVAGREWDRFTIRFGRATK